MPFKTHHLITFILFLCICTGIHAQRGIVSGVIEDESGPIPGVSVIVIGTTIGTETDFDGNYSIECQIGDILQFSFVGMKTREVKVTRALFGNQTLKSNNRLVPVQNIISNAYVDALKKVVDSISFTPKLSENGMTYNKQKSYFEYNRIKNIRENGRKINISYFKPDTYFQIRYNNTLGLQFVDAQKLPKLQNSFSQGRPSNGSNQWFGPETNELFSFGPSVNLLTFDGSNYDYDINGRFIPGTSQNSIVPYRNELFESGVLLSNNLNIAVATNVHAVDVNLRRKIQEDLFGDEQSNLTQFDINYNYKSKFNIFFKSNLVLNRQPNTNGFINNLILSSFVSPVSFQNSQGDMLSNGLQRSFNPAQFNNPLWLLERNKNKNKTTSYVLGTKGNFQINDHLKILSTLSFTKENDRFNFALPIRTVGFENGYLSVKDFSENSLNAYIGLDYDFRIKNFAKVEPKSSIKYKNNTLKYNLVEQTDFTDINFSDPANVTSNKRQLDNNELRIANSITFDIDANFDANVTLKNNSVFSSLQGSEFFLPSAQIYLNINEIFGYSEWINFVSIAAGIAKEAKSIPLFYNNLSHNSLNIAPQESLSFLANNDLFNSKNLMLETATNFDIETNIRLFNNASIGLNYYYSKTQNGVFPILTNGVFELQNIASIQSNGWEASLSAVIGRSWDVFKYQPTFIFSNNRGKVMNLSGNRNSIPIAGFNGISKDLIVGQQTGTIVGSAFLRNSNGAIIIDSNGYPTVATDKKIIGNTTPDFNLSMSNAMNFGKFKIDFLIDYQKGGDVWNGTQNVLNYTGRSQESASLRNTSNFIFTGVDASGNTNIIPVDFANPTQDVSQNRWVRYGFTGVDEAAIKDGSFINLKSVSVSYDFAEDYKGNFFRQLELSLYANNLVSFTKEKGISPYSSLFDHASGDGLDYFNMPIVKEIGFKINIKI